MAFLLQLFAAVGSPFLSLFFFNLFSFSLDYRFGFGFRSLRLFPPRKFLCLVFTSFPFLLRTARFPASNVVLISVPLIGFFSFPVFLSLFLHSRSVFPRPSLIQEAP